MTLGADNRRESEKSAWVSTLQPSHFILFCKQQGVGGGILSCFFACCVLGFLATQGFHCSTWA